jgi:hypothetical protein
MSMKFQVSYKGGNKTATNPTECPVCHHAIVLTNNLGLAESKNALQVIFLCPNIECKSLFICYYVEDDGGILKIEKNEPFSVKMKEFSETILSISENFAKIYEEAYQALNRNYEQIAGPGFRKAFEFLIKDYAKSTCEKSEQEKINKMFCGDVVKNYISQPKIKKMAERALWLGNDESHYLKIWKEKDITDLINLINLSLHWIETEHMTTEYEENMTKD